MKIGVIFNGRFVADGLINEFGKIVPSMLPVSNVPLLKYQVDYLHSQNCKKVYIVLSDDTAKSLDLPNLKMTYNIQTIIVQDLLDLIKTISKVQEFALKRYGNHQLVFHWGDSLFNSNIPEVNFVGYTDYNFIRNWIELENGQKFCGLMSISTTTDLSDFNSLAELVKAVSLNNLCAIDTLDFGSTFSYYNNCFSTKSARSFNSLIVDRHTVTKISQDEKKMKNEYNWFVGLPPTLTLFTPKVFPSHIKNGYQIERMPIASLNNVLVYGAFQKKYWVIVSEAIRLWFDRSLQVAHTFKDKSQFSSILIELFVSKTINRVDDFGKSNNYVIIDELLGDDFSLQAYIKKYAEMVCSYFNDFCDDFDPYIMHGDLCFSNILFDSRTYCVKLIDPKGVGDVQLPSFLGLKLYDEVKLSHSIMGMYDFIIVGSYDLDIENLEINFNDDAIKKSDEIYKIFCDSGVFQYKKNTLIFGQMALFLSMLPLHSDSIERQIAFLANLKRLEALVQADV